MKGKIFVVLITGILIGLGAAYFILPSVKTAEENIKKNPKLLYSCGMHPEVISEEPGNCPICGMKLTPIKITEQAMDKKGESQQAIDRKILYWRAPMDPTEIYDKPGKSKMGMDLIPVYEGDEAGGAGSITIDGSIQQNMNLRIADVKRRDLSSVIRAYGKVKYAEDKKYSVNTKINGWIENLYIDTTGERVRKGQPLLEIYAPELVATQEELVIALENQKKSESSPFEEMKRNAQKMVDLVRNRLELWDISRSEIDKIEKTGQMQRTTLLRSRVSGIVLHKAVNVGDKVGPGMDLFHIVDLSKVWVEASVYESELPLVEVGQKVELELDHVTGEKIAGKVDFIYPFLDQKSHANNVRIVFNNPDLKLKPEMNATVWIYGSTHESALTVPAEAIIHSGTRKVVFVAKEEGKFEPREVKIGTESNEGFVEIISGLFEGEKVVTSGQFLLDSESRTREAIAKMRAAQAQEMDKGEPEKFSQDQHEHAIDLDKSTIETPSEAERHKHETTAEAHTQESQVQSSEEKISVQLYACPMHPEFITSDPDTSCPECGMRLVKIEELEEKIDLEKVEFYTCPMHPDFLTTDKEARCPDCGMKLEKKKD